MFPANYSNTHIPRQVNFDNYPGRDGALYKVNMSEPLFDREKHLNLIKPKAKGILQFGKMQGKKQLQTLAPTSQQAAPPQDSMMPSLEGHSRRKAVLAILAASNKKAEKERVEKLYLGIGNERLAGPKMDKMFPRGTNQELPVYMQNNNCRIAMSTHMGKSFKDNAY